MRVSIFFSVFLLSVHFFSNGLVFLFFLTYEYTRNESPHRGTFHIATDSIDIEIIDQPNTPPAGAGEVAIIAGPPAIANAIRRATSYRALRLPITYADTKN